MKSYSFFLISIFFLINHAFCQENKTKDSSIIRVEERPMEEVKTDTNQVFEFVEVMPQFPGGDQARIKFLQENLHYPEAALENEIQGTVVVQFVVTRTGEIDNIKIKKSPSPILSEEAIRVIKKMPKWIPGQNKGKAVPCYFSLPVTFKLM